MLVTGLAQPVGVSTWKDTVLLNSNELLSWILLSTSSDDLDWFLADFSKEASNDFLNEES
ncbi:hypothetical protein D3C71_1990170 [compost metagenome]